MLFLNLENQLFLILVLTFSFLLFISALVIKFQPAKARAFGISFVIPLVLTSISFIMATYNKTLSSSLLILSHTLFLLNASMVMVLNSGTKKLMFLQFTPFIFLGIGFYLSSHIIYARLFWILCILILSALVVNLVFLINTLFHNDKSQAPGYAGLFILASALSLWLMSDFLTAEALILLAAGYLCCSIYLYKNSLSVLYKEYRQNSDTLKKMNTSIQAEVIRRVEEIERANRRLLEKTKTDTMTGLIVKSVILEKLDNMIERSPREKIAVLMFDIDSFKTINDTLGHQTGDLCIRTLANYIRTSFRKEDMSGRYGGDEFLILLPGTPAVKAFAIADRFRELIQKNSNPAITISIGISSYPEDGTTSAALIEAADKALYASKQKGRNCVTLYSTHQP